MNKIGIIIQKEYLERVKGKGFIISTILIPIVFASFILVPLALALFDDSRQTVAVIDETGKVSSVLLAQTSSDTSKPNTSLSDLILVPVTSYAESKTNLTTEVENGTISGYAVISNTDSVYRAVYYTKNISNFQTNSALRRSIEKAINTVKLQEAGFDVDKIRATETRLDLTTTKLSGGKEENSNAVGQFALSYVMVMLIYGTVLTYGIMVMSAVIEEKSSKVMEVMMSSVTPFELMMGKILGIGAVAVTQYLIWGVAMLALSAYSVSMSSNLSVSIPPMVIVYFVVYFLLGYLVYATLYAAVGSAFENAQDAQSLQTPITMLVVIAFLAMSFVLQKPDSPFAIVLSLIPFFTPILMMARITATDVPLWQIGLSIVLMLGTFYAVVGVAAKIYRVGVLMYGKKPTLSEILKWTRYS